MLIGSSSKQTPREAGDQNSVPWGMPVSIGLLVVTFFIVPALVVVLLRLAIPDFRLRLETQPNLTNALFFIGLFVTEAALVAAVVRYYGMNVKNSLRLHTPKIKELLMTIPAYLVYLVALLAILQVVSGFIPQELLDQDQSVAFTQPTSLFELALTFVSLVVLTPIIEEVIFRGFIFQGFKNSLGVVTAAIVSSLLFGLVHLQLNVGIDTFILGLTACWLFIKTNNLWPVIFLHAIKNGVAFVFLFVLGTGA